MASKSTIGKPNKNPKSNFAVWENLTWSDLENWAGSRTLTRGKSYQKGGYVSDLRCSNGRVLLAWVQGSERYATRVDLDTTKRKRSDRLSSECSCPVGFNCKHAVAVVLQFLKMLEDGVEAATAEDNDPRWAAIEADGDDEFDDEWDDEADVWEEPFREEGVASEKRTKSAARQSKQISDADIRSHLESKPRAELIRLLMQICNRDRDVRKALSDETALAGGKFDELLREACAEMRSLTAEDAWHSSWSGEGHLPDYSGLEKRLKTLLEHGHADEIVTLGEELMQRGVEQIERSHDEGETSCEIARCMSVVRDALLQSTRSNEEKILFTIDLMLADDFDMLDDYSEVLEQPWKQSTWSTVADRLRQRLDNLPLLSKDDTSWSTDYHRERISGWTIESLDKAGRSDEATRLSIDEARRASSYRRAVRRLMAEKDIKQAEQLALEGLEATSPKYPGIIHELQNLLCEIAAKNKDWILPAAVAADRFFFRPSVSSYRELLKAARKANCEPAVKQAALEFLETGQRPDTGLSKSRNKPSSAWPLPMPPAPALEMQTSLARAAIARSEPFFSVLIDLAIAEKQPVDVLKWFDRQKEFYKKAAAHRWMLGPTRSDVRIAEAVEKTHSDRAIEIYRELAESIAVQTNTKTYPEVGHYLKRIKSLLNKTGSAAEWSAILDEFRLKHGRKPRLMQIIDGIADRPIVQRKK